MAKRKAKIADLAEVDLTDKPLDTFDAGQVVQLTVDKHVGKVYCIEDFSVPIVEVENLQTKKRYTVTVGHFINYQKLLKLCK